MENNDKEVENFRKKFREDLQHDSAQGIHRTYRQRIAKELRLTGLTLVAIAIIIAPAYLYLKNTLPIMGSELSTLFVPWLFSCQSDCP